MTRFLNRGLQTLTPARRGKGHRRPADGFRPRLEDLEDRTVPTVAVAAPLAAFSPNGTVWFQPSAGSLTSPLFPGHTYQPATNASGQSVIQSLFQKGTGTVVRSTLRAVPATVPVPCWNRL
jgi:hypothetical protein